MFRLKSTPTRRQDIAVSSAEYLVLPLDEKHWDDYSEWSVVRDEIHRTTRQTIVLDAMDEEVLSPSQVHELADALMTSNVRNVVIVGDNPDLIRASLKLELEFRAVFKARLENRKLLFF